MNQKQTLRALMAAGFTVATLFFASLVYAHPATERYIPIGYWLSVGGEHTYIGSLTGVSPRAAAISFNDAGKNQEIRMADDTKIWIDRSHLGLKASIGKRSDIKTGVKVEVKIKEGTSNIAEWVKVQGSR